MELFTKAKVVKLRSHLEKYLVADDDQETVRQSRNGSGKNARWFVELVQDKPHVIRLKSCHGKHLAATDIPFLLGITGKMVLQTVPDDKMDWKIQWKPIREGSKIKLKTWCGRLLLANGGVPPWRNAITHDEPHNKATKKWVLWDVEVAQEGDNTETLSISSVFMKYLLSTTSFSSLSDEDCEASSNDDGLMSNPPSPQVPFVSSLNSPRFSVISTGSPKLSAESTGMDLFLNGKVVRLRSRNDKYLLAEEDEESVFQDRNGSSENGLWTVEFVPGTHNIIRLKSSYNKYLTASNQPFLHGMTGKKVIQTPTTRLDSTMEWEPIREGSQVKLKTRSGNFLRANWRNSVTHDNIPHRNRTRDWILWDVEIVETDQVKSPRWDVEIVETNQVKSPRWDVEIVETNQVKSPRWDVEIVETDQVKSPRTCHLPLFPHTDSLNFESTSPSSVSSNSGHFSREEYSSDNYLDSPPKSKGRTICYQVADDDRSEVGDEAMEGYSLSFKGNGVDELTHKLKEETGLEDVVVCARNPLNGKLCPLSLQLPPNNMDMHVVLVPLASKDETSL